MISKKTSTANNIENNFKFPLHSTTAEYTVRTSDANLIQVIWGLPIGLNPIVNTHNIQNSSPRQRAVNRRELEGPLKFSGHGHS